MKAILGRKLKMSQIFDKNGKPVPVTLISAGPCFVTAIKTKEKDGYSALQLGYEKAKRLNKPEIGHLKKIHPVKFSKAGPPLTEFQRLKNLREFHVEKTEDIELGGEITSAIFKEGDDVRITSISKGKGFAGVIKRHGFARGPETHGSDHHRHPGSIGSMFPQRVVKGRKMPGHMGVKRITIKKVKIVKLIPETNIIMVRGAIPGPKKSLVEIRANE